MAEYFSDGDWTIQVSAYKFIFKRIIIFMWCVCVSVVVCVRVWVWVPTEATGSIRSFRAAVTGRYDLLCVDAAVSQL